MDQIGSFHLRCVISVAPNGAVGLADTNARVLLAGSLSPSDVGRMAVCQDLNDGGAPVTVVLGLVEESVRDTDAPTVISAGESSIALYPDGHIRLRGEQVTVDSAGALRLLAGRIDLN
ncbi:MAG: hypothetical protein EP336_01415 [Rhodobacteraceae bacterium]|nr:MAG: hypothetical protein EP336_01415 [Paracoccaceae bacterium]